MIARPASKTWTADLALLGVALVWGANYSVVKTALAGWPPMAFNAARCLIAALLMVAIVYRSDPRRWLPVGHWRAVVVLGAVWNGAYQILFILAITRVPASNTALIFSTAPVMIALWRRLRHGERASARLWIGTLISVAGVALVLYGRGLQFDRTSLSGDLFALLGTMAFAGYSVYAQRLNSVPALQVSGWGLVFTAVVTSLAAVPSVGTALANPPPAVTWIGVLYSGVLSLALNYWLYVWSIQRIGATHAAVYLNLVPVLAVIIAAVTLGEVWTIPQWIGGVAVIAGVYLVRR